MAFIHRHSLHRLDLSIQASETGINTLYSFLRKKKCFQLGPINGSSDTTYRVAAAITLFTGGSKKYFCAYHAELTPKKDSACESMDKCHLSSAPIPELQWLSW